MSTSETDANDYAPRAFWGLLSVAVVLGGILDLTRLASWPAAGLFRDTAVNALDAIRVLNGGGPRVFFANNGGREGLFIDLVALSFRVFGVGAWQAKLPSVAFGLLGIVLFALLGRKLFGARAGVAAAFLAAASPGYVMLSRSGFRASMVPALAALAVLSYLWALDTPPGGRAAGRWLLAGAAAGLGFHSYTSWPAVPAALLAYALWLRWHGDPRLRLRLRLRLLGCWALAAAAVGLPAVLARSLSAGGGDRVAGLLGGLTPYGFLQGVVLEMQMPFLLGDANWRHNVPLMPLLPVAAGGLLLLLGIYGGLRNGRRGTGLLLLLAGGGILTAALTPPAELPHLLRSTVMLPSAFLLSGLGYDGLARRYPKPLLGRVPLAPIVLAAGLVLTVAVSVGIGESRSALAATENNTQDWYAGRSALRSGDLAVFLPPSIPAYIREGYAAPFVVAAWPRPVTVLRSFSDLGPGQRAFVEASAWAWMREHDAALLPSGIRRDAQGYLSVPAAR